MYNHNGPQYNVEQKNKSKYIPQKSQGAHFTVSVEISFFLVKYNFILFLNKDTGTFNDEPLEYKKKIWKFMLCTLYKVRDIVNCTCYYEVFIRLELKASQK